MTLILMTYQGFLFMNPDNFKLGMLVSMIASFSLYAVTRNFFFSLFAVYFVTLPLKTPAKQYPFLYASPIEYIYDPIPDGIFDFSYYTVSTIWGWFLLLFFANRAAWLSVRNAPRDAVRFISLLGNRNIVIPLLSWIVYFLLSAHGSLLNSFNPYYSLNYLVHESNIIIIYLCMIYLLFVADRGWYYLHLVLLSSIAFHGFIGLSQVFNLFSQENQLYNRLLIEPEQKLLFQRISGILGPNQHAYLMALYGILLIPVSRFLHKNVRTLMLILVSVNIIFTQSRTVWMGMGCLAVFYCILYRIQLLAYVRLLINKGYLWIGVLIVLLISIVVIPRLSVSGLFFEEQGGWPLRKQMIKDNIELLYLSPLFGFGAGGNVRALLDHFPDSYITTFPSPVHFTLLQLAIEGGVPAAIAFFIPYYSLIRGVFVHSTGERRKLLSFQSVICSVVITIIFFSLQSMTSRIEFFYSGIILGFASAVILPLRKPVV